MQMNETMIEMDSSIKRYVTEVNGKLTSLMEDLTTFMDAVKDDYEGTRSDMKDLKDEIVVLKRTLNNESSSNSKVKVPEPKDFNRIQNAKELENFLWDMEQ